MMENWKNDSSSPKMRPRAKLPITDPLKFGSAVFSVSMETENWHRPLWKIGKMALAPQKHILEQNSELLTPLKYGSMVFRVSTEAENWHQQLWTIGKMALASQKCILEQNC